MEPDGGPLSATQRNVIETLKRRGEATATELADALHISASAARQHLSSLRAAGLVATRQERGNPGRPADHYHATPPTETLFAAPTDDLALDLLDHLAEEHPDLVEGVFQRRRRRLAAETLVDLGELPLGARLRSLADRLDAQGYLADLDTDGQGQHRLNLHGCAVWPVAARYRQACDAELDFLREVLPGAAVRRVSHKTSGCHTCTYEVDPSGAPTATD